MRNLLLTILIFAPWHSDAAESPWYTHANIGSYARHQMPFWESENVGWKIWFANALDVYAKRKPVLMSNHLYMENLDDRKEHKVEFIGTALIVKKRYKPEYQYVSNHKGNHTFRIGNANDNTFEFMVSSAWSEGAVYNNKKDFTDYIRKTSMEYNSPVQSNFIHFQKKE